VRPEIGRRIVARRLWGAAVGRASAQATAYRELGRPVGAREKGASRTPGFEAIFRTIEPLEGSIETRHG